MWSMYYVQRGPSIQDQEAKTEPPTSPSNDTTLIFPRPSLDLAFDDDVFERVAKVWRQIIGADAEGVEFLVFADREGEADEDEDED
jgi:hypothetical protein